MNNVGDIEFGQNNTASGMSSKKPDPSLTFEGILEKRNIEEFVHFTRIENLISILDIGLLSVKEQKEQNVSAERNDLERRDGLLDAISLSVSFPNYKMFYSLTKGNYDGWVILSLDPKEIVKKECLFFSHNAACDDMVFKTIHAQDDLTRPDSFEKMFADIGDYKRNELKIPDNYSTDPQAEIMVNEKIPVECIQRIYFPNNEIDEDISDIIKSKDIAISVNRNKFNHRLDYRFWPSNSWMYRGIY